MGNGELRGAAAVGNGQWGGKGGGGGANMTVLVVVLVFLGGGGSDPCRGLTPFFHFYEEQLTES